jgi:Polysaccharide biosynthesis protein.
MFHFIVSRKLGPELYGEFMVLYSLMLTVGFLSNIYPTLTIKAVLENKEQKYEILRFIRIIAGLTGLIFFIGLIISLPFVQSFLKITHEFAIIIVGLVWLVVFLSSVEKGFLQAQEKFKEYSFLNSFELTFRLIIAVFLIEIGLNIYGAVGSSFFAELLVLIIVLFINKNLFGKIKKIPIKDIFKTSLLSVPVGLFVYADDLFIKRVFDPTTAGLYASASILGKALIWFCMTLFSVIFVKLTEDKTNYRKYLLYSLGLFLAINLIAFVGTLILGKPIFLMLFGSKFLDAYQYLPFYILAIIPLIFNLTIFTSNITLERFKALVIVNLVLYYLGFILINFHNVYQYILYIFLFHFISFMINLYFFLKK